MTIETLKTELWRKVIGNSAIAKRNHYYEEIQGAILKDTGYTLSRDTIRNFIEGRNNPSPRTLDIYATFILGGTQEEPKTFQDFLDWWEEVQDIGGESSTEEEQNANFSFQKLVLWGSIGLIILLLLGLGLNSSFIGEAKKHDFFFRDTFLIQDVNTLLDNGWLILDPEQRFLDTLAVIRHEEDYLHLFTLKGDYWDVWGGDSERLKIKNMFVHEVECECCVITTEIDCFYPTERYQQAGLFLFDDLDKDNFIRITYTYTDNKKLTGDTDLHMIQVLRRKNRKQTELLTYPIRSLNLDTHPNHEKFAFQVYIEDGYLELTYNTNDSAFRSVLSIPFQQEVDYVGLGAFHGNGVEEPVILPVRFDYLEIIGCDAEF